MSRDVITLSPTTSATSLLSLIPPTEVEIDVEALETDAFTLPPPRYVEDDLDPSPVYDRVNRHPDTLARHLFQLGFIFPPLWMFNIVVLAQPIHPTALEEDMESEPKTQEERWEELEIRRAVEIKWARRSLIALAVFSLILAGVILLVLRRGLPSSPDHSQLEPSPQ